MSNLQPFFENLPHPTKNKDKPGGKLSVFCKKGGWVVLDGGQKVWYDKHASPAWPRCPALPVADEAGHKRVPGSIADAAACRQGRDRAPQTGE